MFDNSVAHTLDFQVEGITFMFVAVDIFLRIITPSPPCLSPLLETPIKQRHRHAWLG